MNNGSECLSLCVQDMERKGKGWFMEDWIRAVDVWLPLLGIRVSSWINSSICMLV